MTTLDSSEIRAIYSAEFSPEEFKQRLAEALADTEAMDDRVAHIRWFKLRFPTALSRLQYARQMTEQWTRNSRSR